MPSVSERLNDSGQTMHHLRRVGPPATKAGVVDIMDFRKVTSIIGRNGNVVDFYLDSSDNVQCHLLSRQHARVVRLQDNQHKLFDDSLNGVFVNHVKISGLQKCSLFDPLGAVILSEGDLVTFGHMMGNKLAVGIRVRQPDSEYQFIVSLFTRVNFLYFFEEGALT
ncbi:hypothetical protein FSP39_017107 [Pinctada imbricata]|uniref:FHA domain-containing protein n=1 Tax=Pinctada imbricata TaxID=66713 RepID=A0AA89BXJ8_PINIB|nr:hypothetical protein FSP39_017107 [Pinctada imbricata]